MLERALSSGQGEMRRANRSSDMDEEGLPLKLSQMQLGNSIPSPTGEEVLRENGGTADATAKEERRRPPLSALKRVLLRSSAESLARLPASPTAAGQSAGTAELFSFKPLDAEAGEADNRSTSPTIWSGSRPSSFSGFSVFSSTSTPMSFNGEEEGMELWQAHADLWQHSSTISYPQPDRSSAPPMLGSAPRAASFSVRGQQRHSAPQRCLSMVRRGPYNSRDASPIPGWLSTSCRGSADSGSYYGGEGGSSVGGSVGGGGRDMDFDGEELGRDVSPLWISCDSRATIVLGEVISPERGSFSRASSLGRPQPGDGNSSPVAGDVGRLRSSLSRVSSLGRPPVSDGLNSRASSSLGDASSLRGSFSRTSSMGRPPADGSSSPRDVSPPPRRSFSRKSSLGRPPSDGSNGGACLSRLPADIRSGGGAFTSRSPPASVTHPRGSSSSQRGSRPVASSAANGMVASTSAGNLLLAVTEAAQLQAHALVYARAKGIGLEEARARLATTPVRAPRKSPVCDGAAVAQGQHMLAGGRR